MKFIFHVIFFKVRQLRTQMNNNNTQYKVKVQ